jgi:RecJ-like exonuclease
MQEEQIKIKQEKRYNRVQKRKMEKKIHHNVFTKKYRDKKTLERAWRFFLGEEQFKILKKQIKENKNDKVKSNVK